VRLSRLFWLGVVLASIMFLVPAARGAVAAEAGEEGVAAPSPVEKAAAVVERGMLAKARAELLALKKVELAPQDKDRVDRLLAQVEMRLLDLIASVDAAQERADAEKGKRADEEKTFAASQESMRQRMAQLIGQQKPEKAMALGLEIANRSAERAIRQGIELYERGEYDAAEQKLTKVKAADDAEKVQLSARWQATVEEYLGRLTHVRQDYAAGVRLAEQRQIEVAEIGRKRQQAELAWVQAQALFQHGEYVQSLAILDRLLAGGISLGDRADREVRVMRAQAHSEVEAAKAGRDNAVRYLASAKEELAKERYRGAIHFLQLALQTRAVSGEERGQALADLKVAQQKLDEQQASALAAVEAEHGASRREVTAAIRAKRFAEEVRRKQVILRQQERAIASQHLRIAQEHYRNANFRAAKEQLQMALKRDADYPEAQKLMDEVLWLLGESTGPAKAYIEHISELERVRLQQANVEMLQRKQAGDRALAEGNYDDAVKQYREAQDILEFLRPSFDVKNYEAELGRKIERAEAEKEQKERKIAEVRRREAVVQARKEGEMERLMGERRVTALFERAFEAYTRREYAKASEIAGRVLTIEPHNIAAKDLRDKATRARHKLLWGKLEEEMERARQRELMMLKSKGIWITEQITYPAKEVWQEILRRGPVPLPSGQAQKTPKELELEEALETRVDLSFVDTPLRDVVDFLKTLVRVDINLDVTTIQTSERLITLQLKDARLKDALRLLLQGASLPEELAQNNGLDYIITPASIVISTKSKLQLLQKYRMDMRIYDIRDFMAMSGEGGGGDDDDDDDDDSWSSNDDDDDDDTTGAGMISRGRAMRLIRTLLVEFTGRENWGRVGVLSGGDDDDDDDDSGLGDDYGGFGEGEGAEGGVGRGQGTMFIWGSGDLMVNQTPEIHAEIENLLTQLRGMIENQVYIEVRFLNFENGFLEAFGVTAITGLVAKTSKSALFPKSEWNIGLGGFGMPAHETTGFSASVAFLDYPGTSAVLEAVKESNYATVMQSPAITLMNTEESDISLTTTINYVASYTVGEGGVTVPQIAQVANGVDLRVRPVISADRRYVTLEVEPNFSTVDGFTEVSIPTLIPGTDGGPDRIIFNTVQTPQVSSKNLEVRVRCPDRGTVILGGLSDTSDRTREGGPPILINLPFIKRLFSTKGHTRSREHQVFLVTPTIILAEELEEKIPVE